MQLRSIFTGSAPYMRIFDWVMGFGALAWGLYTQNWWWIAGGVIGIALAWYDPGTRVRKYFSVIKPRPPAPRPKR